LDIMDEAPSKVRIGKSALAIFPTRPRVGFSLRAVARGITLNFQ
jgi:hypothetical protein